MFKNFTRRRYYLLASLLIIIASGVTAFSSFNSSEKADEQVGKGSLVLYNWEGYMDMEVIQQFIDETGIEVTVKEYNLASEMLSNLKGNPSSYDIIVTDGSTVSTLVLERLLKPLDKEKLPNIKFLNRDFTDLYYDPGNSYSVPYVWGTTGLGVNASYVSSPIVSWNDLLDPQYEGKIGIFDEPLESILPVMMSLGHSINTQDPEHYKQAMEQAERFRDNNVVLSDSVELLDQLVAGDLWIVMAYNGDLMAVAEENENINFVIPEEGSVRWVDNFVVSNQSRNVESAHVFLNYIMRPEIAADISSELYYATPNAKAETLLDADLFSNHIIYPTDETMSRLEVLHELELPLSELNKIHNLLK
ncbi:spermidine/putrescine ABC transporter substrate-binding protein [Candidatus Kaiserbacteria bacterium]|nr:spermidine/putrescine ABC transporter substrate-binding protein [Candidatus Kaiserbacteria bacterium]USN91976.1 MAG: spermidine/putrescine ABC transporter substrate-binding protein [Candidatus Nomurabacteria bacterium]